MHLNNGNVMFNGLDVMDLGWSSKDLNNYIPEILNFGGTTLF